MMVDPRTKESNEEATGKHKNSNKTWNKGGLPDAASVLDACLEKAGCSTYIRSHASQLPVNVAIGDAEKGAETVTVLPPVGCTDASWLTTTEETMHQRQSKRARKNNKEKKKNALQAMSFSDWRAVQQRKRLHFPPMPTTDPTESASKSEANHQDGYDGALPIISSTSTSGAVQQSVVANDSKAVQSSLTSASTEEETKAGAGRWNTHVDPTSGRKFYEDVSTGRTQWTPPTDHHTTNKRSRHGPTVADSQSHQASENSNTDHEQRKSKRKSEKRSPESLLLSVAHTAILHRRKLLLKGRKELEWINAKALEEQRRIQDELKEKIAKAQGDLAELQRKTDEPDTELLEAMSKLSMAMDDPSDIALPLLSSLVSADGGTTKAASGHAAGNGNHNDDGDDSDDQDDDEHGDKACVVAQVRQLQHQHHKAQEEREQRRIQEVEKKRSRVAQRVAALETEARRAQERIKQVHDKAQSLIDATKSALTNRLRENETRWQGIAHKCRKQRALEAAQRRAHKAQVGTGKQPGSEGHARFHGVKLALLEQQHESMRENLCKQRALTQTSTLGDWQEVFDHVSNLPYYWNTTTGYVTWTKPDEFVEKEEHLRVAAEELHEMRMGMLEERYSEELEATAARYIRARVVHAENKHTRELERQLMDLMQSIKHEEEEQRDQARKTIQHVLRNQGDFEVHHQLTLSKKLDQNEEVGEDDNEEDQVYQKKCANRLKNKFKKAEQATERAREEQINRHRQRVQERIEKRKQSILTRLAHQDAADVRDKLEMLWDAQSNEAALHIAKKEAQVEREALRIKAELIGRQRLIAAMMVQKS